jgi:hypothetical protein
VDLKSRLLASANSWVVATSLAEGREVPLNRLAKLVMDDGKFFAGLDSRRYGPSVDTLEKFARFLSDPANWPDGLVPEEAIQFAHVTGVSSEGAGPSPDNGAGVIGISDHQNTGPAFPPAGVAGASGGAISPLLTTPPGDEFAAEAGAQ